MIWTARWPAFKFNRDKCSATWTRRFNRPPHSVHQPLIGAAWALTFTFALVAFAWKHPRFDPANHGRPLPAWVTAAVDAPATRWAVASTTLLFAVWYCWRPSSDRKLAKCPARSVLRVVVGGTGRGLISVRTAVAGYLTHAHRLPAAGDTSVAFDVARLPGSMGLPARGCGFVRLCVARAGKPEPGIAARDQDLVARLRRRDAWWCRHLRAAVVRSSGPVRGLQRCRISIVAAGAKPRYQAHRCRQPTGQLGVDAGATGTCSAPSACWHSS